MTCLAARSETVGAFFDIDGTLLPAPSLEWRFTGYLLERNEISSQQLGRWLAHFARTLWRNRHGAIGGNKRYLSGISEALVKDWEKSLSCGFLRADSLPFFEEALLRIAWHRAQGHRVFLVSGTLAPLARVAARALAADVAADIGVCATELEAAPRSPRAWSGRIVGEHMSGAAKLCALQMLAARYGIAVIRSYAYGDSAADLQMLEGVGNAVAVNPTRALARVARKRRWQTCLWEKTLGETPSGPARQFASTAAR
jgi:HAD superfamily hydrolase (TIGR01490 family)